MWLDAYTLDAMGQGVLYALPLLACSIASRSALSRPFPVLREMHELQHDLLRHFTAGVAASSSSSAFCVHMCSALLLSELAVTSTCVEHACAWLVC